MQKKVTQKEIAERVGVSQRTVATVVGKGNERSGVSPALRERILEVARELGYRPNKAAQAMKGARSGLIGHLKSPSYHEYHIAEGIYFGEAMAAKGYEVLALDIQRGFRGLDRALEFFRDIRVEGLLFSRQLEEISASPAFAALQAAGVPAVSLEALRAEGPPPVPSVVVDHAQGMTLLMDHLLGQGFRRIAMVASANPPHFSMRQRIAGYEARMRGAGLEPDLVSVPRPDVEPSLGLGMSLGWRGMEMLLERGRLPEAVCFQNDHYAEGALALCRERGISVPGDLAVAGFDNASMGKYRRPALTSVEQPTREVADAAADLLVRLIRGGADPRESDLLRLPCRLRVRDTTAQRADCANHDFCKATAKA